MKTFDAAEAERLLRERLDSLENDTKRCFVPIAGLQAAPFPAVLYAFATVDYLSSCWKGWNRKPGGDQTKRLVQFLMKFCRYGKRESRIAVEVICRASAGNRLPGKA